MPDPGAVVASLLFLLLVGVMLAFAFGTQRNVRIGNAHLAWLQPALPALGPRTTLRWLGSSAVQLDLVEPAEPFREVTILVVMEPRDVPIMWLLSRQSGRRDTLILRTSLRRAPRFDLEATTPAAWIPAPDSGEASSWAALPFAGGVRATAPEGTRPDEVAVAERAWRELDAASGGATRLSIRRTVPHLEVHLRPAPPGVVPSERMIRALRELALGLTKA